MTATTEHLAEFTGTNHWFRHSVVRRFLYTDGAKFVAERGGAYWLLDEIAFRRMDKADVRREPFQVWTLTLNKKGSGARLLCENGDGRKLYAKQIDYTDFLMQNIKFYVEHDGINNRVLMLPSER